MWFNYRLIRAFLKEKRAQEGYGWFWIIGIVLLLITLVVVIYIMVKSGKIGQEQIGALS